MAFLGAVRRKRFKVFLLLLLFTIGVLYLEQTDQFDVNYWMDKFSDKFSFPDNQNYSIKADKWIIVDVTDASRDTETVRVPGWRIIMLGDSTRNRIRCNNCIYFTKNSKMEEKRLSGIKSAVARIQLGAVLHAIHSGADWVFYSENLHQLKDIGKFKMAAAQPGLIYRSGGIMDASRHFLNVGRQTDREENLYRLWSWSSPAIQKIWTPTESVNVSDITIDYRAPHVLLPSNTFLAEPLTGCLFHRNAFWAFAPLFIANLDHAVIWSFWTQRLLWEYEGNIELLPPLRRNKQELNKHVKADIKRLQSVPLEALQKELSTWKCGDASSFYVCVRELAKMMVKKKYFSHTETLIINEWLPLLDSSEPIRKGSDVTTYIGHRVIYNRGRITLSDADRKKSVVRPVVMKNPFYELCKMSNASSTSQNVVSSNPPAIDDIVLIIILNAPNLVGNIKFITFMYGRHFSHIVVCGASLEEFTKSGYTENKILFIEVNTRNGYNGYICMMEVMQMGYDVKGFLQMSDDALLNVWNIGKLPRNQIWFQHSIRPATLAMKQVPDIHTAKHWWPWSAHFGQKNLLKVWEDFSIILKDPAVAPKVQAFLKQLADNSGKQNGAYYEASDIYYIPAHLKEQYVFVSSWFLKNNVFLEIAIPTVINGLVPRSEIVRMPGKYLWYEDRVKYKEFFNASHCFLHPFKLATLLKNTDGVKFICEQYLPKIDHQLLTHY